MMMEIGSKVKCDIYKGVVGIILSFETNNYNFYEKGRIVLIRIESEEISYFIKGSCIRLYEKDLNLIKSTIDINSIYQYCSKCDVLTANKIEDIYTCCDHKQ